MVVRLGQVLYWFACGLAALLVAFAGSAYVNRESSDGAIVAVIVVIGAVLTWLTGRGILYVLTAR